MHVVKKERVGVTWSAGYLIAMTHVYRREKRSFRSQKSSQIERWEGVGQKDAFQSDWPLHILHFDVLQVQVLEQDSHPKNRKSSVFSQVAFS